METGMKKLAICVVTALFIFPFSAFGYGYPDAMGQGSPLPGVDPVSHGFGGVMSVNVGSMNLFCNPAELTAFNPSFTASIGSLILKQTVDDGAGKHNLTYAGLGASSFQTGLSTGSVSLAMGIAKIRDYTYKGEYFFWESEIDTIPHGFENLIVDGGVWESAAGFATTLPGKVSFGLSGGYRFGEVSYDYYWHHFAESIPDSIENWNREEGEFAWRAGVSYPASESITFGAVYSSASENCPASIASGLSVGNLSAYFPGFGVEARIYDTEINKAWTANFFGGIHPDHNLYFRGGLILASRGGNDANTSLGLAVGATIDLGKTDISAAFNFGSEKRNDFVLGFPYAETITDVITAFSVGATIEL